MGTFEAELGDRKTSPLNRPYAMFHALTSEENEENILDSFASEDGRVRILFATVTFGMGLMQRASTPSSTLDHQRLYWSVSKKWVEWDEMEAKA